MADATLRLPGFVNAHSHAFQRALRGRVEHVDPDHPHDDFWTWREAMYQAANAIDPDGAYEVALRLYREMVAAGYTAVGEFHYPHHQPGGEPYPDPNAMAKATAAAAGDAGIEIVMLMTAYARAGWGLPPTPGQRRFCDADVASYLARVDALASEMRVGLAPHSVRAVPRDWLERIARHAADTGMVVHIHANEQRREVDECIEEYGMRPIELLAEVGLLGPRTTVVHATHVSERELDLLAETGTTVCACPTTEANLGDGFPPVQGLCERGIGICIGSDSNVRIDPLEELRELEGIARRQTLKRNVIGLSTLLCFGSDEGAAALGLERWPDVEVDLGHASLAGVPED
ncbi:MAG TPA: formimidoylglutamate deiminase, partial [Gaiellales bacterium]|nr:formimidoylglutamate deiminase [Gaiellales bacterium]